MQLTARDPFEYSNCRGNQFILGFKNSPVTSLLGTLIRSRTAETAAQIISRVCRLPHHRRSRIGINHELHIPASIWTGTARVIRGHHVHSASLHHGWKQRILRATSPTIPFLPDVA